MTGWKIPPLILRQVVWRYGLAVVSVGVALAVALLLGGVSMFAAHSSLLPLPSRPGLAGWAQASLPYSFHF